MHADSAESWIINTCDTSHDFPLVLVHKRLKPQKNWSFAECAVLELWLDYTHKLRGRFNNFTIGG